ncbi:MAG: ATP-binding protein [Candidatus Latescibacterota bacterium]
MEKLFNREIAALDDVFGFIDGFIEQFSLDADTAFATRLVVEELFTNLVKHNQTSGERILIRLARDPSCLTIMLKDFDVDPFDASQAEPVDIRAPLDRRRIGHLGIHIVKGLVDTLTYQYTKEERTLCVTAVKNLEAKDVRHQT